MNIRFEASFCMARRFLAFELPPLFNRFELLGVSNMTLPEGLEGLEGLESGLLISLN